ncbi:MAG: hypothetical protein AAGD11_06540, partial [Planctomycetota bacterium]
MVILQRGFRFLPGVSMLATFVCSDFCELVGEYSNGRFAKLVREAKVGPRWRHRHSVGVLIRRETGSTRWLLRRTRR